MWSIHPRYLDARGLVALWREGLLAQKVLRGETQGYRYHPQLNRFKETEDPKAAITGYLKEVLKEARRRGYCFDEARINEPDAVLLEIPVSRGQLVFEFCILLDKLGSRNPERQAQLAAIGDVECNPVFKVVEGPVAVWEKARPIHKFIPYTD